MMTDVIAEHLDIWTSALINKSSAGRGTSDKQTAYGIRKLRELILELAVRGKLVPQDPNDEPASILLSKIFTQQKIATTKRKARNSSELTKNLDYEKPFALPAGWVWVSLDATGNIFNGNSVNSSIKQSKYTNLDSGLPFIATKDVGYGWDELDYGNGVLIPFKETGFRVAHKNAVLVCAEGGSAGKKCGITKQDICFGNKLFAIELYGEIEPNYILANYLTPTFFQQFKEKMTGIIGGISSASFSQLMIPLPPLAAQHRIVAKVDELMALCDQLEQQQTNSIAAHQSLVQTLIDTLTQSADAAEFEQAWSRIADHFDTLFTTESSIDQLKQTILKLAVMGKLSTPNKTDSTVKTLLDNIYRERKLYGMTKKEEDDFISEYETAVSKIENNRVKLKARFFCCFITKGTTPSNNELITHGEIPFLKVYNIVSNQLDFDYKPIFIDKFIHDKKLKRSKVFPGNVIMNIVGPPLGKVAIVTDQYPEWNMNQALAVFRPIARIYNRYIYYVLSTQSVLEELLTEVKGTAGQDNLSLEQCRDILIPIPSIEEQHRIVTKVDELMALCDTLKVRIAAAQTTQIHLADAIVEQAVA